MQELISISILLACICSVKSQFAQCTFGETCKPFQDCPSLKSLTEKGFLSPQERDLLRSKQCNSINRVAYVCCTSGNNGGGFQTQPPPATFAPPANNAKSKFPKPPTCGISLGDRIYGGESTDIDEHPWTAQLWYQKPGGTGSHCGGSLINQRYVITAAHCEKKVPKTWKLYQVRLGDYDTRTNPDIQEKVNEKIQNDPYVEVRISDIIVHENYDPESRSQYHDIALLRLQRDVVYTDFIKPICLPTETSLRSIDFTGNALEVVGYGKTETSNSSPLKLKVELQAISDDRCRVKYNALNLIRGQMCAGGEQGKDSCNGDSGGPLLKSQIYPNSVTPYYMLIGLVSFGPKNCGTFDQPGVYTRVSEYMQWINANVR